MAEEVGDLVAKVSMDQTGFQEGISKLNRQMKVVRSEFQAAGAKLSSFGKSAEGLKLKADSLTKQLEIQRQRVLALETAHQKALESKGADAKATQNLEIKMNKAKAQMAKMEYELKKTTAELEKQSDKWHKLSEACNHAGNKMADVGKSLAKKVSAPMAGLGVLATKAAIDVETAFAGVRKTIDASEEEFAQLKDGFMDMSKEIPIAVEELMGIGEAAGQLGIAKENILGFSDVMAKLGVTTNLSAQDAAMALARLANIMQMPQDQFDRLGATIVDLGNNLATTEREIVEMGLRLAGAGKQAKMSEADVLSIAGALSSVGIEAEAGGTAFSRVMLEMNNQVMGGGKKLQAFAKVAGMSAQEFSIVWKNNAAEALAAFIDGLGRMQQSGQNVVPVLEQLGLNEIRVRDALLRASGAGDLFAKSIELGNQAWEENVALNEEAEERFKTTASLLQKLRNYLKILASAFGEELLPIINNFVSKTLTPFVEKISDLSEGKKKLIIIIGGLLVVLPPLIWGIGKILTIIPLLITALGKLKVALLAVGAAMKTLVANPIGLVIMAVAAVIAAVVLLRKAWVNNWGGIQEKTYAICGLIDAYVTKFVANIAMSFQFLKTKLFEILKSIVKSVEPLFNLLPETISGSYKKVLESMDGTNENMQDKLDALTNISNDASERITENMQKVKEAFAAVDVSDTNKTGEEKKSDTIIKDLLEQVAGTADDAGESFDLLGEKASKTAKDTRAAWERTVDIISTKMQILRTQQESAGIAAELNGEKSKALADKIQSLNREYEMQKQIIAAITEGHEKSVKAKGAEAEETLKLAARLEQEKKAMHEIERQIRDTTKALKEQSQQMRNLVTEIDKVEKKYRDDLAEALRDYQKKATDINKKLIEDERKLSKEYDNELNSRARSLSNFVGLFDDIGEKEISGDELLKNLQGQVTAFEGWQANIAKLASRGIDEGLIEELRQMGPKAGPEIAALNTLTDEQLVQYVALWKQKNQAARNEAVAQLQQQKLEMRQKLQEIRATAAEQLERYRAEWEKKNAEIRKNTEEELKRIEDKFKQISEGSTQYGISLMDNFVGGMESRFDRLKATLEDMATMVDNYMPHSPAKKGALSRLNEWGPALVDGLVRGIKNSMGRLESVTAQMAMLSPGALRPALANYSANNTTYGGNTFYIDINGSSTRQQADDLIRELRKRGVRF